MTCGCVTPIVVTDLAAYQASLGTVTWTDLVNVVDSGGSMYRSGGTPGDSTAHAVSANFVEGTGCGLWECRQFFDDVTTNNQTYVIIEDETGSANKYGWHFTNQTVDSRRAPRFGGSEDFPIYYGPAGGPAPPDQVGYNVGFRFGIYYNNGTVGLYENEQWTNDTNDFFGVDSFSYTYTGLDTSLRWRVKVYPIEAAIDCHTPVVTEFIPAAADVCVTAAWSFPPFVWHATGTVTSPPPLPAVNTVRFDEGEGSSWYLIPPVTDSGNELRSKVVKSMRATGRLTNASMKAYSYDIGDEINVADLEAGTNATTRAQDLPDSTQVAQSPRKQINAKNAVLHTVRIEGSDVGNTERDEVHELAIEVADEGVRR